MVKILVMGKGRGFNFCNLAIDAFLLMFDI